ncbi:cyclic lactone autoinducer peptide [Paenibacillus psychroresistens]|nr:cyclic lactone autoinducer peptide [Paenibacillus psychroresistens]
MFIAKVANNVLTFVAKKQALTGCYWLCHEYDIPEELL